MLLLSIASYGFESNNNWAKPINDNNLKNFHQVAPLIYRSAQPYHQGFKALEQYSIKSVLDLRLFHKDMPLVPNTLKIYQVPLFASVLNHTNMIKATNILANTKQPILVHCLHGSDRTGAVIALYRMVCQDWSKQSAIQEMTQGDFGYHSIFGNIPHYLNSANIANLRKVIKGSNCPASPKSIY